MASTPALAGLPALPVLAASLAAAILTALGVALVRRWAPRAGLLDVPGARSSHTAPTPRGGGIAIATVFLGGAAAGLPWLPPEAWWRTATLLVAGAAVAVVGLIDDLRTLPVWPRLGVHVLAAGTAVPAGVIFPYVEPEAAGGPGGAPFNAAGAVATVFWVAALANVYNFMDGIDGMAAGSAVIAAGALALISWGTGIADVFLPAALLAGASAGFLVHNYPPARIFMGDAGSAFLGFTLAWLVALAARQQAATAAPWLAWALFAIPAPFLFDGGLTLARRVLRGEPWYRPHRTHYYQRLVRLGYTHRQVTHVYYGLALVAALGVTCAYAPALRWLGPGLLALDLALLIALVLAVRALEQRRSRPAS